MYPTQLEVGSVGNNDSLMRVANQTYSQFVYAYFLKEIPLYPKSDFPLIGNNPDFQLLY